MHSPLTPASQPEHVTEVDDLVLVTGIGTVPPIWPLPDAIHEQQSGYDVSPRSRNLADPPDTPAEPRIELADVVAHLAVLVDPAGVVTGAEVAVTGAAVGEQVPDDHQDRAGDGDHGFELAAAAGQAPVAFPGEGVGPAGRGGGLAEYPFEVRVAFAGLPESTPALPSDC